MVLISSTNEHANWATQIIGQEYRLQELAGLTSEYGKHIAITINNSITNLPDWEGNQPPLLLPSTTIEPNNLLGHIYYRLGNLEKAYTLFENNANCQIVTELSHIVSNQITINEANITANDYFSIHNKAVALHYGNKHSSIEYAKISDLYEQAKKLAPTNNYSAFTTKQYATYLLDNNHLIEAAQILQNSSFQNLGEFEQTEINALLCSVWLMQAETTGNFAENSSCLKDTLWQCLKFYEKEAYEIKTAMMLCDAAQVATLDKSYSEALGYVNRAIAIFQKENLNELTGQAQMQKGALLKQWAYAGNSQFFRPAIQAYQEALNVFTREAAPDIFAEIHHQLGIIYAEVPEEIKKKGIWASVSVSSFNEALNFYNKIDYPTHFAVICSNMGTAYTKYPQALKSDNYDKALAWFREALDVFTAKKYPKERTATLLNYLHASWFAGNTTLHDEERYADMEKTAMEILNITTDAAIILQVQQELKKLEELGLEMNTQ